MLFCGDAETSRGGPAPPPRHGRVTSPSGVCLRRRPRRRGDLYLIGYGELARHLLANGLVDEVRFWLHPAVGGEGTRPYRGEKLKLRLLDSTQYDSGVTLLRYAPA